MVHLGYTLIAFVIVISLSIALEIFLSEYLLFRYDTNEQLAVQAGVHQISVGIMLILH